jgi:hypothetical protein
MPATDNLVIPGFTHPNSKFMIQYILDFLAPGYPGFFKNSTGKMPQPS